MSTRTDQWSPGTWFPLLRDAPRWIAGSLALLFLACSNTPAQTSPFRTDQELLRKLVAAAVERTHHSVRYISDYVRIPHPGGDVPADTGVCIDEVIRSYRAVGMIYRRKFM